MSLHLAWGWLMANSSADGLTKEIHALGAHWRSIGAKRVALHLPNDTENLVASFGMQPEL